MAAKWKTSPITEDSSLSETSEFIIYDQASDKLMQKALKLSPEGKLTATKIEDTRGGSLVPAGTILMWWGEIKDIPEEWVLCDGQNGTPDLQGQFIRGAFTTTYKPTTGERGGGPTHTHTAKSTITIKPVGKHAHQMPEHWYGARSDGANQGRKVVDWNDNDVDQAWTQEGGEHTHDTDGGVSVDESGWLPNWVALSFIMKKK